MLVREILEGALLAVDSDAGILPALKFFNDRYQELASRVRLRHLRKVGEVIVEKNIVAGTVDLTQSSRDVPGDATALAAWQAIGATRLRGRMLQVRVGWYEIADLSPTGLVLTSPYAEASETDKGYTISQRYVKLDPAAVWLGPFAHPRLNRMMFCSGQEEMDMGTPGRVIKDGGPWVVLQGPADPVDGSLRVEVYPPVGSDQDELLRYIFWARPSAATMNDHVPSGLAPQTMKEGIICDLYRREFSISLKQGAADVAATWRNEFNSQRTMWNRDYVNIAGDVDNAIPDDSAILLLGSNGGGFGDFDPVTTAYDDVRVRWSGFS